MRFVLDGKTYEVDGISRLSLMDVLRFNRESERGDWGVTWADIEDMLNELRGLTDEARTVGVAQLPRLWRGAHV